MAGSLSVYEARELVSLFENLVEALEEPRVVEYEVHRRYSRTYWYVDEDDYEVYELRDDQREFLLDLLFSLAGDIRSIKILEKLPEILLNAGALSRTDPVRVAYNSSGGDTSAYEERIELYRVKTPFIVVQRIRRSGEGESVYIYWEFNGNEAQTFYEIDEKAVDVFAFCGGAVSIEEIQRLLEKGYEVERAESVEVDVGSVSTSVADWSADYKVLCGSVHEEVVEVDRSGWGDRVHVRLVPEGGAVVKYSSAGTLSSWNDKKIYLLGD